MNAGSDIGEGVPFESFPDAPPAIWYVDNFGNAKTTLIEEDIRLDAEGDVRTKLGTLRFHERLKDVPHGEAAFIVGSSGIGHERFLEITKNDRLRERREGL